MSQTGSLTAIYLRAGARIPVKSTREAKAIANVGLEGDHARGGRRQITVLSEEGWAAACREFGSEVDPSVRRANLLVRGIDLGERIRGELRIGEVVIEVLSECRPCELLDQDGNEGLCASLRADRRAGVSGRIVQGGDLKVGMDVS